MAPKKAVKKKPGFDGNEFSRLGAEGRKAFTALQALDKKIEAFEADYRTKKLALGQARDAAVEKHRALVREMESMVTGLRWNPAFARYESIN